MPMRRRRFVVGAASLAIGSLTLVACGGGGDGDAAAGAESDSESESLRMFTYDDPAAAELLTEQLTAFTDETGIDVTLDTLPGSGAALYPDKLRTELLGGNAPDVWRIWGGELAAPFARAGQAADLSAYYEEYGWDETINANAIDGMTFEGTRYGVPAFASAMGIWYSREAFEEAGIEEPTTYEELTAANEQLVEAGMTPLGTGGMYGWHLMRLFQYLLEVSAGPELHDQLLAGEASWDDPAVVEAFEMFVNWQEQGWIPEGALGLAPSDVEPGFVQGLHAYTITGQWGESEFIAGAGADPADFGTFVPPTGHDPERYSGFVEGFMIAEASPNKDAAAQLVDFLMQPDVQRAMANTQSTVLDAAPDPEMWPLSAQWADFQQEAPYYLVLDQAYPKDVSDGYFQVQSDVIQGSITPQQAAEQMEAIVSAWASER